MNKAITAVLAALTLTVTLTGCSGSGDSSSKDSAATTTAASTTNSTQNASGKNKDSSHFKLPTMPVIVTEGSAQSTIMAVSCNTDEHDGQVDVSLAFSIDPENNNAKKFSYKITDESGSYTEKCTLSTDGPVKDDVIVVKIKTHVPDPTANYTIEIVDPETEATS